MERGRAIAAVSDRVAQRADDLGELRHRPRPPVRHDERQRVGLGRADVDEVNALAVDRRGELREAVELCLGRPPVVAVAPVAAQLLQVAELGAVVPTRAVDLVREAGLSQARPQVVEHRLGHVDDEGLNVVVHGVILTHPWFPRSLSSPAPAEASARPQPCSWPPPASTWPSRPARSARATRATTSTAAGRSTAAWRRRRRRSSSPVGTPWRSPWTCSTERRSNAAWRGCSTSWATSTCS